MKYLKAVIDTKSLIVNANNILLTKNNGIVIKQNIFLSTASGTEINESELNEFTNESVFNKLASDKNINTFVISDFVTTINNGRKITYYLYKGYNKISDKGLVYFQLIDKETLAPTSELQFSNIEDNIFLKPEIPTTEESSCNAIETKNNKPDKPEIAFLIGHMNEERLIYDIERLIIDTVSNVHKHKQLTFKFIIRISKFGGSPSEKLEKQIEEIEEYTHSIIQKEFTNAHFEFELEI